MLDLILKDNGGDQFVESNHGKLFREPSREAEDLDEVSRRKVVDDEQLTVEDIDAMDLGFD